jgi:hypothetical protein
MFDAFETVEAVTTMIRSEYGERISHTTVWKYKRQWIAARRRELAKRAAEVARDELLREGRI